MNTIARTIAFVLTMVGGAQADPVMLEAEGFVHMEKCEVYTDGAPVKELENGADPRYTEQSFCIANVRGTLLPMLCNRTSGCGQPRRTKIKTPEPDASGYKEMQFYMNPWSARPDQWAELILAVDPENSIVGAAAIGLTKAEQQELVYLP